MTRRVRVYTHKACAIDFEIAVCWDFLEVHPMIRAVMLLAFAPALAQAQSAAPPSSASTAQGAASSQAGQQAVSPAAKPADAAASLAASVAPGAAVITAHGVCEDAQKRNGPAKSGACDTVLTKEQFETLLNALNPGNQPLPPSARRNLAQAYVDLLAFSAAAERAGINNSVGFQEVMRLVRMRTLADLFQRSLAEKLRNPPPAEVEEYYNKNLGKFEEVKLRRVFVPRNNSAAATPAGANPATANKDEFEKKAQQLANDLRERLAKGEDPDALQKEAYTTLAVEGKPVPTDLGSRRKGTFPAGEEEEILSLPAGGVSRVRQQPAGFVVYKVESRQAVALEKVKDEISRELFRTSVDAENNKIKASVHADFNDTYFGPASAPPQNPQPPK